MSTELENLRKIEHLVILVLENRSFDHMLGYLSLDAGRKDVDGLRGEESNSDGTTRFEVAPQTTTALDRDPCHLNACVMEQIADDDMSGFVRNFSKVHPLSDASTVMGYYGAQQVPAYDLIARHFAICDRWFSSYPGDTWPNRLYTLCGTAHGHRKTSIPPVYHHPTFFRHLTASGTSWRCYSHDIAAVRLVDPNYRFGHRDRFRWFRDFRKDVNAGELAAVTWIDPNFVNWGLHKGHANDDHPPADIRAGQALVASVLRTLADSEFWKKCCFLITYDEHGGFYDHVVPPKGVPEDHEGFDRYGIRVPVLVASPWVKPASVSKRQMDHTSLVRTVLERFCRQDDGTIPDMGVRVAAAGHLGHLLTEGKARGAPLAEIIGLDEFLAGEMAEKPRPPLHALGMGPGMGLAAVAPQDHGAHASGPFHQEFLAARRRLIEEGVPPDDLTPPV